MQTHLSLSLSHYLSLSELRASIVHDMSVHVNPSRVSVYVYVSGLSVHVVCVCVCVCVCVWRGGSLYLWMRVAPFSILFVGLISYMRHNRLARVTGRPVEMRCRCLSGWRIELRGWASGVCVCVAIGCKRWFRALWHALCRAPRSSLAQLTI